MNRTRGVKAAAAPPRKTIATRVLASFAVTVVAFAVTVGWSVVAQRRAAVDSEELSLGYLPAALTLGQLRASQVTLSTLVDGIPDERNPVSTRFLLETLARVRHQKFAESRESLKLGLSSVGGQSSRELAAAASAELSSIEATLEDDKAQFEELFAALDSGDKDAVNRILLDVGPLEHTAERRVRDVSDRIKVSMDRISEDAQHREQRAIYALIALAVLTLGVGVAVSIHTRRLLAPLARVTERAQAVAHGDLTPQDVIPTEDEIGDLAMAFERMVGAVANAQAQALSNERLAAIGKMAAHVTHEIRNPLSSIGLNIELLEEELLARGDGARVESRALLQAIAREVQRLEHLSEEYLRLARLPSPRMEAEDIAGAVNEVVAFSRAEMDRADCRVRVDISEKLPPALFDEAQIRQALLNLLRNAREAMPQGGDIDVIVRAEGMSVVVRVNDRGGGIPDEIRPRVFDPFFSTKGEGTGLGLAITRQIVVAHGGTVTAEPREG
ncbi:MAG TPA: ATP-binding protein, partial [Polyangiaceae bacterium]|nr:ATP-binding protein [Polyangiaceae bacterium]